MTNRGKIRITLTVIASISLGISFLSLYYMNRMVQEIEEIAYRDAKIAELGEILSILILEARREENC